MKTDKELLGLALKAFIYMGMKAGMSENEIIKCAMAGKAEWNPLTDDGDAFRLAVKLDMNVDVQGAWIRVDYGDGFVGGNAKNNSLAATRRAIVRAAAAIGESMPQEQTESS